MLTRITHATLAVARRVLPERARRSIIDALGRRRFTQSMITRESRSQALLRRTFTSRRPTLRHLDVHVTDHCNLGCKGCEHYSPLCEPHFADVDATRRELVRLAELFEGIEQIFLLGGEPLLHPRVADFVHVARDAFPTARLCLMTNGILVTRMEENVWRALRDADGVLLCDDYPIKLPKSEIERLGTEYGVPVEWMPPATEFFKAPIDPSGSCDAEKSFTACQSLSNCAIIRDGRLFACAHIAHADAPAAAFDLPGIVPSESDSIDIFNARDGDEIIRFLTSPAPWCRFCDYEHAVPFEWGRTRRAADEWVAAGWLEKDHERTDSK